VDFTPVADYSFTGGTVRAVGKTFPVVSVSGTVTLDSTLACTAFTLAAGDTVLGDLLYTTASPTVGAGSYISRLLCVGGTSIPASRYGSATFGFTAPAKTSLSGDATVDATFTANDLHLAWGEYTSPYPCSLDLDDNDLTVKKFVVDAETGSANVFFGAGSITAESSFSMTTKLQSAHFYFEGCSLTVGGPMTWTAADTGQFFVSGAGKIVFAGASWPATVELPIGAVLPNVYCNVAHASGVSFDSTLTCSTLTVTSTNTVAAFKAGVTHTVLVGFTASGTLGTTTIESDTPGTSTTLALPAGSVARGCTVTDIVASGTVLDARGSRPGGGCARVNFGGE